MSRIHAAIIGLLVAAAVAVGANAAFDQRATAADPGRVGAEELQRRAERLAAVERALEQQLAENPPVDTSPIVKYVPLTATGGTSSAPRPAVAPRGDDDHESWSDDDHDNHDDHSADRAREDEHDGEDD